MSNDLPQLVRRDLVDGGADLTRHLLAVEFDICFGIGDRRVPAGMTKKTTHHGAAADLMQKASPLTVRSGFAAYFTFWAQHMDFLELLAKNDLLHYLDAVGDEFLYTFVGLPVQPGIPETLDDTSDLSRYSYYFTAGGLKNVLWEWISEPSETRSSPEQVTAHLMACIAGLSWFLESE